MADTNPGTPLADEFFVGYLAPMPRGYARRARAAVLALTVLVIGAAAVVAGLQPDTGDGVWETDPVAMTGLFIAAPYPVLITEGESKSDQPRTVILVGAGKCGAFQPSGYCGLFGGNGGGGMSGGDGGGEGGPTDGEPVRPAAMKLFDEKLVQVKGTRLRRGGRMAVELEDGERAVTLADDDPARVAALTPRASVSAAASHRGWIVDPKCYLGAMKPGEGKTHKACAVRCIAGGIPPLLVETGGAEPKFYLLGGPSGTAINHSILPFVGDEVVMTGTVQWEGSDIELLTVSPIDIRRP